MRLLPRLTVLLAVLAAGPASAQVINEIRIDAAGSDDHEYIELKGTPLASAAGLSIVVIGDGAPPASSGVAEEVIDLNGLSFDADGFLTIAEPDSMTGTCDAMPGVTVCTPANGLDFENNDNVTFFLVDQYAGVKGDDLDVDDNGVLGIDIDDDGIEDTDPWASVLDRIAVIESINPPAPGFDWSYGPPNVGPADVMGTDKSPGHVYRCGSTWWIGNFDFSMGLDSPAMPNPCAADMPDAGPPGTPDAGAVDAPDAGFTYNETALTPQDQPGIICSVTNAGALGWLPLGIAFAMLGLFRVRRRR